MHQGRARGAGVAPPAASDSASAGVRFGQPSAGPTPIPGFGRVGTLLGAVLIVLLLGGLLWSATTGPAVSAQRPQAFGGSLVLEDQRPLTVIDLATGAVTVSLKGIYTAVGATNYASVQAVPLRVGTMLINRATGTFNLLGADNYLVDATGAGVGLGRLAGSSAARGFAAGATAYIVRYGPTSTVTLVDQATVQTGARLEALTPGSATAGPGRTVIPKGFESLGGAVADQPASTVVSGTDLWTLVQVGTRCQVQRLRPVATGRGGLGRATAVTLPGSCATAALAAAPGLVAVITPGHVRLFRAVRRSRRCRRDRAGPTGTRHQRGQQLSARVRLHRDAVVPGSHPDWLVGRRGHSGRPDHRPGAPPGPGDRVGPRQPGRVERAAVHPRPGRHWPAHLVGHRAGDGRHDAGVGDAGLSGRERGREGPLRGRPGGRGRPPGGVQQPGQPPGGGGLHRRLACPGRRRQARRGRLERHRPGARQRRPLPSARAEPDRRAVEPDRAPPGGGQRQPDRDVRQHHAEAVCPADHLGGALVGVGAGRLVVPAARSAGLRARLLVGHDDRGQRDPPARPTGAGGQRAEPAAIHRAAARHDLPGRRHRLHQPAIDRIDAGVVHDRGSRPRSPHRRADEGRQPR